MVDCHTRSVRDNGICFVRVPSVIKNQGEVEEERSTECRRMQWLAAISREGMIEEIVNSGRVCGRHFVCGRSAHYW